MLFPDFRQDFAIVDDFDQAPPLASFDEIERRALAANPDLAAAQAALRQQNSEVSVARAGLLPSFSFDYFYGINANQVGVYDEDRHRRLGSVAQGTLNVPVLTWGAARSRLRQSRLRVEQAQLDLSATGRELQASLRTSYLEAQTAGAQLDSLRRSQDLAAESLRLTLLRYEAGDATALEVSDAQATLAQARNATNDGQLRYRLALAQLQTLTGVL